MVSARDKSKGARSLAFTFMAAAWFAPGLWAAEPQLHPIDRMFTNLVKQLPMPANDNEGNGLCSVACPIHGSNTFNLLDATARRIPVKTDDDLIRLIPWMRHADSCLRYIAIKAVMPHVGFDLTKGVSSNIVDTLSTEYHEVMIALHRKLKQSKVDFDKKLFDGMFVTLSAEQARSLVNGKWEEPFSASSNYHRALEIDDKTIAQANRREPGIDDSHNTANPLSIKNVTVNSEMQIIIAVPAVGHPDSLVTRTLWPVSKDIIWLSEVNHRWTKLQRVQAFR